MSFVKLYGSILKSSIWLEDQPTRLVWITMLASADENGIVEASVGGLAHAARVTREECETALRTLSGPDPDSRDGTTGERIEKVDGGWLVLNHSRYRDKRTRKQHLAAERQRRYRSDAQSVTVTDVTPRHGDIHKGSVSVSVSGYPKGTSSSEENASAAFDQFWRAFGKRVDRKRARAAWAKIDPAEYGTIIDRAAEYRAACVVSEHPQKHPTTWLNGENWRDEELPQARTRSNGQSRITQVGAPGSYGDEITDLDGNPLDASPAAPEDRSSIPY